MRRHVSVIIVGAFFASLCAMPAYAHCHEGRRVYQHHEAVCESVCEDGYLCGVDGHYCIDHREDETCNGYIACEPVRRSHHHHGRH